MISLEHKPANSIIVLDFETTGLSPDNGDRAIEIGAVKIEHGKVVAQFQELMNPGFRISDFIEQYTGITNRMLADAPPCAEVMARFADFIQGENLLAHNASFDQRFLDAELQRIDRHYQGEFACSLLVSRRIYPQAPNHKLGTLIAYKGINAQGNFHRALFDAQMTAKLWHSILADITEQINGEHLPFELIKTLSKTPKKQITTLLSKWKSV